ncbi:hypothetical protein SAMN02745172_00832 [Pseudoxanthobacter soli DSM 19599]|uniref:Uncharacterized protein n=1 Tax=Pseudoxanthobacter soli DSM 19599 TaxID=1123029 RepID=A0A1M7Z9P8_9HYPH|nr:hypothetical protein SAMN02745172_00832 [Pseudoxanthobacter soli DSM 19599]
MCLVRSKVHTVSRGCLGAARRGRSAFLKRTRRATDPGGGGGKACRAPEYGRSRGTPSSDGKILVRTAGLEPALPFEKQIFLPLRLSPPPAAAGVRGLDYPFTMAGAWSTGGRRRPSSLYTFPDRAGAYAGRIGLGSGLAWARAPLAFPEFGRFYAADFPAGTPIQSLLRLPVSPRPLQVVIAPASTTGRPRLRARPPCCPERQGENAPAGSRGGLVRRPR